MKRVISVLLIAVLLVTCLNTSSLAAKTSETVSPYYNNANSARAVLQISDFGKMTLKLTCQGISGVTTKITAVSYVQRKVGLVWVKVDNGLDGKKWTDTVNGVSMNKTHTLQLEKTGTYRAKVEYTVYGSGGSADVIEKTVTAEY